MDWRTEIRNEFARLGKKPDDSVVEELTQHAAAAFEAARADGASAAEAAERVRSLVGSWCGATTGPRRLERADLVESAAASSSWLAGIGLDVRHAMRLFQRHKGFAAVSVMMIALGIGATATIFSVVNGVLLKPLPWPTSDQLVRVSETRRGGTVSLAPELTNATYLGWLEHAKTIDGLGGYGETTAILTGTSGAERVPAANVTASLFPLLGVSPLLGKGFTTAEDELAVVILSYGFWQERFGGAPDVIGRTLRFSNGTRTIVGVMPDGFMFPTPAARVWLPMHVPRPIGPGGPSQGSTVTLFTAIAKLKAGATAAQAAAEAEGVARALPDLGPVIPAVFGSTGEALVTAQPLADAFVGEVRAVLWILLAAVVLLWLAAVGNVASMQMAHAVARRREVAVRAAIGAGTMRLVRQLFVENAVLGILGGAAGVGLTAMLLRALPAFLPSDFPRSETLVMDARVIGVAALLAFAASLVIALLPARLAASLDLRSAIAGDAAASGGWRQGPARSRQFIIAGQVAIAAILLVGGALLGRSFFNLLRLDRGFDGANVVTARVQLPPSRDSGALRDAAFQEMLAEISRRPGVIAAGFSEGIPLGGSERRFASMSREAGRPDITINALLRQVTPGYLEAMGMRRAAGRFLEVTDTFNAEPVAVVNRTFARRYLSDNPVGAILPAAIDSKRQGVMNWRVVGVIEDVLRGNSTASIQPEIFVNASQLSSGPSSSSFLTVRSAGDAAALATEMREIVRAVDSGATIDQPVTMAARLMKTLARPRLYAVLFAGFSVFAALVAMGGLFGGLSYGVTQRTKEIALRSALGASRWDISRLIIGQGVTMTLAGLVVGLSAAALSSRLLSRFLFGVTAWDGWTFAAVAVAMLLVAMIACAIPARRAASIDPLKAR
jgi:putative ABC transport system permease protein